MDRVSTIQQFFDKYQKANKDFDVDEIAVCYAEAFLFGQPQGVHIVKKEDFIRVIPKRKELMQKIGEQSSIIFSLKETNLDEQYVQVEVVWKMTYQKDGNVTEDLNGTTYILHKGGNILQIVAQIDHQDIMKKIQELNLLPSA